MTDGAESPSPHRRTVATVLAVTVIGLATAGGLTVGLLRTSGSSPTGATVAAGSPGSSATGPAASGSSAPGSAPGLSAGTTGAATGTATVAAAPPASGWLSGAAGDDAARGAMDAWRATPLQIGATWDNGNAEQVAMRTVCPGGPWARWTRPLDVAVGGIDVGAGESWAAAARGAYDGRWRRHLTRLKECWGPRNPALLYIRFAHEMNLPQKWQVRRGQEHDFVTALTRYSALRYQILPQARIVLCPNDGTDPSLGGLDVRRLWPGKDGQGRPVADVYAVDSYNMSPHVNTPTAFATKTTALAPGGLLLGLEQHRRFAARMGVPFAVPEWGNNADRRDSGGGGESPTYVQAFYDWARRNAGDPAAPRPGQLLYEVNFNLWSRYELWPHTRQPRTAAAYRALPWGH